MALAKSEYNIARLPVKNGRTGSTGFKKAITIVVVLLLLHTRFYGQVTTVTGIITTASNYPVRGARVRSDIDKKTVFTDSLGSFTIPIHLPDNLIISFDGLRTQKISLTDSSQSPVAIRLMADSSGVYQANSDYIKSQALQESISQTSRFNNSLSYGTGNISGTTFPSFSHKEATEGSMYLLDNWAKGIVTRSDNGIVKDDNMVYNYNKINGSLIMTNDMKTAVTIDKSQINRFILIPASSTDSLTFVTQPLIGNSFVQLLSDGSKYKLYKKIETTFKKADFQTTGLTSSGNNYDEYIDKYTYYILTVNGNTVKQISFKQKSITETLAPEAAKLPSFFAEHKSGKLDETGLVELVEYVNK